MIIYFLCVIAGTVFYRMGGSGKFNRLWRTLGIPLLSLTALWAWGKWHWSLWICLPLMYATMTTYWKCLNKYFKKPTTDAYWFNWFAHGLMIGLSLIPYMITRELPLVIVRAVLLAFLIMIWSEVMDDVDWEECGRGFLIMITLCMV